MDKHIILLGFKHVGKSTIGKALSLKVSRPFIDLDQKIELLFKEQWQKECSCREIMQIYGELFFRDLESQALLNSIGLVPAIISLGGGTPLTEKNQGLIASHCVIYIKAPRNVVFERIMETGQPAFLPSERTSYELFNELWDTREKVYQRLANFSVENNGTVEQTVENIIQKL
jgi:shikimate kinase